jgi:hypothetical protein
MLLRLTPSAFSTCAVDIVDFYNSWGVTTTVAHSEKNDSSIRAVVNHYATCAEAQRACARTKSLLEYMAAQELVYMLRGLPHEQWFKRLEFLRNNGPVFDATVIDKLLRAGKQLEAIWT